MSPFPTHYERLLLVEGADDVDFFFALLKHMQLTERIFIISYDGKNKLQARLKALAKMNAFKKQIRKVGIVRDADDSASSAFASIQSALANSNRDLQQEGNEEDVVLYPVPPRPQALKEFVGEGELQVRGYVLPDNQQGGMLEDLLWAALDHPELAEQRRCIEDWLACIGAAQALHPENIAKARMHLVLESTRINANFARKDREKYILGDLFAVTWWDDLALWDSPVFAPIRAFVQAVAE